MLDRDEYYHVVQHIFDVSTESSLGFEVLLRHQSLTNPETLFKKARKQGTLVELDLFSIKKFLQKNSPINHNHKIFFNIFPSTLVSSVIHEFFSWIQEEQVKNIVFELNESNDDQYVWDSYEFINNIQMFRQLGIEIAIDDVGKGQSNLKNIRNINPDYIKLDKFYGFNISDSVEKKDILSAFAEVSANSNIKLILEGIETEEDYETAKKLGISYMQGFYLDIPKPIKESA
ncbi:EAL domain-containing protein [Pontibacillus marinus]|uniref:EAL domain-containing protein n=1 Tax=Pontibacillus marinus BH030004 = DSM 16465 TaxID=1385511 RepID=A0A0A5GCV1_9BACI|nr:EAL domain-containing protein [Pontibacillus marinus]KGX91021.1 hypothetical protein N783_13330 [Pontibacillus marinus BH030004 = DSM 16465]